METILIIDNDLHFVFWLGSALAKAGYETIPAKSVPDAIELLNQIAGAIDLLILNPASDGVADFVRCVSRTFAATVIAVVDPLTASPGRVPGAHVTILKPQNDDERWKLEFLDLVHNIFSRGELGRSGHGR